MTVSLLRCIRGWNQKELAEAAGMDKGRISLYELGKKVPSRRTLERLAAAAGVPFPLLEQILPLLALARATAEGTRSSGAALEQAAGVAATVARAVYDAAYAASAMLLAELAPEAGEAEEAGRPTPEAAQRERERAQGLWEQFEALSTRDRRVLIEGAREFRSWALCEKLCAESARAADADAGRAMELADLALQIALQVRGEESWRAELQGYAWLHLAHARRAADDLPGAQEALAQGEKLWRERTAGNPPLLDESTLLAPRASAPTHYAPLRRPF